MGANPEPVDTIFDWHAERAVMQADAD